MPRLNKVRQTPVPPPIEVEEEEEFNLFEYKRFKADPKQTPIRIDKFVMDRVEKISRNQVQNAIREGTIRVDDKEVKPNHKISPGEEVVLYLPDEPFDISCEPENIPLDIRYEDDDILIVHKPVGLVCHPGVGNYTGTLVNGLLYYFQNTYLPIKEGHEHYQPGLVHRIDKDTSGLMVVAKSDEAMRSLSDQFRLHTIERTYQAIIWGQPNELEGTITMNVGRDPRNPLNHTVFPEGDMGKHSVTHYRTIEPMYYVSLIECRLETGRTHQIRVHMKSMGHPLFADERYGGNEILKGTLFSKYKGFAVNAIKAMGRQALHAKTLGLVHPTTGEKMHFDSDLPEDMATCLKTWRDYLQNRKEVLKKDE